MPRSGTSRRWIKLHCEGAIHGSIVYQLTDAEQAVWFKLLAFAGIVNRDGQISDNDGRPFPHQHIAHEIHVELELLEATITKCLDEGRLTEDEHGLHITNWTAYQSDYNRQRPYRNVERKGKRRALLCKVCGWKGITNEVWCPKCAEKGVDTKLETDYQGQQYGQMVQR